MSSPSKSSTDYITLTTTDSDRLSETHSPEESADVSNEITAEDDSYQQNLDDSENNGDIGVENDYIDDIDSDLIEDDELDQIDSSQLSQSTNSKDLTIKANYIVKSADLGQRVDKVAAEVFSEYSRAQLQDWIKSGNLTLNGTVIKSKHRVKDGDELMLNAELKQHGSDKPEDILLDIIYEDESVLVINKPVGMVVHPGAGNWSGTLVNGLLFHFPNQAHLPRAGLVHRIDKNTSGLLVIGKTKSAQLDLQDQLKDKSVYRHYQCVVAGDEASLSRQRVIDAPIGRHKVQRTKMSVTSTGKPAITHIMKISPLNKNYSLLDVRLETGRTHQIRVHLSHIGHPIIGDDVYGNRQQLRAGLNQGQRSAILNFPRQALHAYKLGFIHPDNGELIELTAPLPDDIVELCHILKE